MGETKAELQRRCAALEAQIARFQARDRDPVLYPTQIEAEIRERWDVGAMEQESFWVVLLNSKLKILDMLRIHIGTVGDVSVHPREVFREAVRLAAHSIVVAHNHPSGDVHPSEADNRLTHRLREAGKLMGIPIVDHLILTATGSFSYQKEGKLGYE